MCSPHGIEAASPPALEGPGPRPRRCGPDSTTTAARGPAITSPAPSSSGARVMATSASGPPLKPPIRSSRASGPGGRRVPGDGHHAAPAPGTVLQVGAQQPAAPRPAARLSGLPRDPRGGRRRRSPGWDDLGLHPVTPSSSCRRGRSAVSSGKARPSPPLIWRSTPADPSPSPVLAGGPAPPARSADRGSAPPGGPRARRAGPGGPGPVRRRPVAGCSTASAVAERDNAILRRPCFCHGAADPRPRVAIVMGSDSDLPTMEPAVRILEQLGVATEVRVSAAHRTPWEMAAFAEAVTSGAFG